MLDIGCGNGKLLAFFARKGSKVVGIDRSKVQVEEAQKRLGDLGDTVEVLCADVRNLEFKEKYDLVTLVNVILDTSELALVVDLLDSAYSALRRGGKIIIWDVHPHNVQRPNHIEDVVFAEDGSYYIDGSKKRSKTLLCDGSQYTFHPNFHYQLGTIINGVTDSGFKSLRFFELGHLTPFPTHFAIEAVRD